MLRIRINVSLLNDAIRSKRCALTRFKPGEDPTALEEHMVHGLRASFIGRHADS